jgi:hypothetical protein
MKTLILLLLLFGLLLSAVISVFLWFLGRGRDWKMRNDEIFERELRIKKRRYDIQKQNPQKG